MDFISQQFLGEAVQNSEQFNYLPKSKAKTGKITDLRETDKLQQSSITEPVQ